MGEAQLALLVLALAFAGLVKGVTGMGLPLFATPILAAVFGARAAVVIMSIPVFVANFLLIVEGRRSLGILRAVWGVALGGAAGVVLGLFLLLRLDQAILALVIAALVVVFLARGDRLLGDDPNARRVRILGPTFGAIGGVLMGTTSIAAPVVAGYVHSLRLPPRDFVVAMAVVYQALSIVQVIGLWRLGAYEAATLGPSLFALIPMLLAFAVGVRVRRRLDNAVFRRLVAGFLALSALVLVGQGLRGLGVIPA